MLVEAAAYVVVQAEEKLRWSSMVDKRFVVSQVSSIKDGENRIIRWRFEEPKPASLCNMLFDNKEHQVSSDKNSQDQANSEFIWIVAFQHHNIPWLVHLTLKTHSWGEEILIIHKRQNRFLQLSIPLHWTLVLDLVSYNNLHSVKHALVHHWTESHLLSGRQSERYILGNLS